mgnify:CR=1 FL=1
MVDPTKNDYAMKGPAYEAWYNKKWVNNNYIAMIMLSILFIQLCFAARDIDDRFHTIREIVEENNYSFEEHNVTTDDGYILSIHRV